MAYFPSFGMRVFWNIVVHRYRNIGDALAFQLQKRKYSAIDRYQGTHPDGEKTGIRFSYKNRSANFALEKRT